MYRACYKNMLTLVLLELLANDPKNRLAFLGKLCAWVMLRIDGLRSVRKEHVDAREHSLRQLFALLQIPYPIFDVAALGNDFDPNIHCIARSRRADSSSSLVTLVPCLLEERTTDSQRLVLHRSLIDWPRTTTSANPRGARVRELDEFVCQRTGALRRELRRRR